MNRAVFHPVSRREPSVQSQQAHHGSHMIEAKHVSKTYPNRFSVIFDMTFEISAGEFVYLFGPSGSGKTTLLRILSCAQRPSDGTVSIAGTEITRKGFNRIHQVRKAMGIVFQDLKLLEDRTAAENISFVLELTGHLPKQITARVKQVLQWVGLFDKKDEPVSGLSAGEKQRIAIARALVNDPPLLLGDEPTGNLDDRMTAEMMKIFAALHQKGTTVLFATHDPNLIRRYPYRVISFGETSKDGAPPGAEARG
jgi:cell division transport system ATP-binding protein